MRAKVAAALAVATVACAPTAQAAPEDVAYIVIRDGVEICDVMDRDGISQTTLLGLGFKITSLYPVTMREAGQIIGYSAKQYCDWHLSDILRTAEAMG